MPASIVWQNKKRNESVTGTWKKAAFQCSLLECSANNENDHANDDDCSDSGGIPLSSATGYHRITHCTSCDNAQGAARPMFPDILVRIPARALGVSGQRERAIPGISGALQSSLANVDKLQAYVAVYSPDEQLSRVRFCFQFCSCIQDAERGREGERDQKESYKVPTEVGLFEFSRQMSPSTQQQQQQQQREGGTCLRNGLQEVNARVFVGGTVASSRCGDTGSQIKRVQMKSVCSVDLSEGRWRTAPYASVFSLCVTPASSQTLGLGEQKAGCFVLHVFPRTIEASDAITKAVQTEQRLGPLLHRLRESTCAPDDVRSDEHRTVFHALTAMLEAVCVEMPVLDRNEQSQSQQRPCARGGMSSAASMSLGVDAAAQFLPDADETSSMGVGAPSVVNQSVCTERGNAPSSGLQVSISHDQPVTTANTEDQHQRLLRRREKWLAERFMALHTRERLHQVQAREQALRTAQVNSATPSSSTVGHNAAESVQEALELQRAEGAAAMQAFQTALLSRVDDGFLKVEASLRDYLKGLMSEHVVNEQHHRAETAKQLEDRLCRKLEERALDFAQGQFRMLQESVRQNQLALQQLYAQTAQRALVASSQHDMEGSSTGTTGGAQSPQAMLYMEQECKPSAAEAGSSPNASFLLEGPSASPFLDAEQEDDSVVVPPASQARIDQSSEDEMLLLRAKEQELRHLESRLRLKENHLLALQEELDERSKGRNDSDSDSVAANDTDTTGMEQGGQAQNSMKEIQLTPPLQLVHGRSASDTGTPAITSRGSGADILLPFQQRSEMSADYDEAGLTRRIDAHDTHRGGDDTDDDDVTPVKGLPVSTEVDSSDSDAKRAVKTTAGPQDVSGVSDMASPFLFCFSLTTFRVQNIVVL